MAIDLATHYLDEARRQFRGQKRMGESAIAQPRDEDFCFMLDPGVELGGRSGQHLAGDIRSRFTDFLATTARSRSLS